MPTPCRRPPPPPAASNALSAALLSRLRDAAGQASPRRVLLQSLALVLTSGLSSSHAVLSSRLLNSLLPHLPSTRLPAILRLLPPDHLTLLLLSSGRTRTRQPSNLPAAAALHALAVSAGHLPADLRLANSLLSLYLTLGCTASARCLLLADIPRPDAATWNTLLRACFRQGLLPAARSLFDQMPARDLVSYNSMLAGQAAAGDMAGARQLFDEMPERDLVSYNTMLAGYARRDGGDIEHARKIFDAMPQRDVVSWNSMLDGHARAGDAAAARAVFDAMPTRSAVSWNVVLALYARRKDWRECLRLFDAMMAAAAVPNEKTFVSVLTACGALGDLEKGRWVHGLVRRSWDRLVPDVLLLTALLTMYAKCGATGTAREIFDSMGERRSAPSWNSMIIGYGLHGQSEKALELFLEMEKSGPRPNETTFVCVLSSCAHGGLVLEGWWCFDRMVRSYGIDPKDEHFGCMMDLLGRAGILKASSEKLIQDLQGKASPSMWSTMISASRTHSNSKLGEFVGKKLIEMKPAEVGPYVLLSNVYAAEGRWDEVEKVREMMKENRVEKDGGLSLVGGSGEPEPHAPAPAAAATEEDGFSGDDGMVVLSMLGEMGTHVKLPSESRDPECREGRL